MIDRMARVLADANPRRGGFLGLFGAIDWAVVVKIVLAILKGLGYLSLPAGQRMVTSGLPAEAQAAIHRHFPGLDL